jgi:GDP-4-dehydro-6-deoxy-D-mannose reductase
MLALITGAGGFVGPYLRRELVENSYQVVGTDLSKKVEYRLDITNAAAVVELLAKTKPQVIFHLAGFSSVKQSFAKPELCKQVNVEGTRNLLEAVKKTVPDAKILIISSAEVYGNPKTIPIPESAGLNPTSPYAESRIEQEALLNEYQLNWLVSRSFNHIGPGQQQGFVSSDFASQIAQINNNPNSEAKIAVGNLEAVRDFSDVRDVVRAYRLLIEKAKLHDTYNVCSGKGISIKAILDILLSFSKRKIEIVQDPDRARPSDIAELIGDNSKLKLSTGWKPEIDLQQTLAEIYQSWLNKISV